MIDDLKTISENYLYSNITIINAFDLHRLAKLYNLKGLLEKVNDFIARRFESLPGQK